VCVAEAVDPFADLADVFPRLVEFEQVRRGVAVERAGRRRARMVQHDNGPFRIDRDAQDLAKVHSGRQLERIRYRFELGDRGLAVVHSWALLRADRRKTDENRKSDQVHASHGHLL
jgi:hypothetical protein